MRILIALVLLLATASCGGAPPLGESSLLQPPDMAEAPARAPTPLTPIAGAPVPLVPSFAPATVVASPASPPGQVAAVSVVQEVAPVIAAPAPAAAPAQIAEVVPAAPPPPAPVVALAPPPLWPEFWLFGPPAGRVTLSNFSFGNARVQAVMTTGPDCAAPGQAPPSNFVLPLNGTRVIVAAPGADVCWRRAVDAAPGEAAPPPGWTEWSRVYTSTGRTIDSRL